MSEQCSKLACCPNIHIFRGVFQTCIHTCEHTSLKGYFCTFLCWSDPFLFTVISNKEMAHCHCS